MSARRRRWCIAAAMSVALFTSGCAGDDAADDPATPDRGADAGADTEADVGATAPHDRQDGEDGEVAADPDSGTPEGADEDQAPVLSVMTTVAPITDLVRMVGGDRVEVAALVPAGADSHTYEPRPQDVARLTEADAYLGVGLDLNPGAVRLAEENLPAGAPVVLLGEVALERDEIIFDHSHGDDGHSHGDDGHSHGEDGHSHGDDGHSHDDDGHSHDDAQLGPNAHVWTSLRNAAALVETIADTLIQLDPDGAEAYRDNATAARQELDELDQLIGDAAATIPAANRTLVTYHDAWSYFARDHQLEFATAVQPADFSEPSAAEVGAVIDLIRERGVPAVFGSEVFPTSVLEAIAEETGAVHVGDLADDELPGAPGDPEHTYLEMMRRNAITIVAGLGGDTSRLGG